MQNTQNILRYGSMTTIYIQCGDNFSRLRSKDSVYVRKYSSRIKYPIKIGDLTEILKGHLRNKKYFESVATDSNVWTRFQICEKRSQSVASD